MEILRYKYVFVLIISTLNCVNNVKSDVKDKSEKLKTSINCPFSKIIEDIFKIHNKTSNAGIYVKNSEQAKIFLNAISNISKENKESNRPAQEELINNIIASINRIKENITAEQNNETKLNEAIIIDVPKEVSTNDEYIEGRNKVGQILSGMEEKTDVSLNNTLSINNKNSTPNSTEKTNYVEILTVEPNNTNHGTNTSKNNIIEVLKHLMPMFNSTLTKELHNITIIERNHNNNHSFSATKNISTIVVTYCDKDNFTKINNDYDTKGTVLKLPVNESVDYDYYIDDNLETNDTFDDVTDANLTISEKKDILEAAEYGVQKMHELYSVMEPKLYSMGFWLDDRNPARYVAAFNAPSEDATKYSRYGYASLQAAARLKQLTSFELIFFRFKHEANWILLRNFNKQVKK